MELCCGGILGMGETLEQRVDFAFELAALDPCEVPINLLAPRPAPRWATGALISPREALQAIALFRLVLPGAWLRLAGGREYVLGELQAMGLLAGANALIVGNYLTSTGRPPEDDHALLDALGMPVADGPGEGRFVVDADGAHSAPGTAHRASGDPRPRRVARRLRLDRAWSRPVRRNSRAGPGQVEVVLAHQHPADEEADELLDHARPTTPAAARRAGTTCRGTATRRGRRW